jgi:transposase
MKNTNHPRAKQPSTAPSTGPRVVGLDVHPDSFAAAILQGRDPLQARVVHSITKQPLAALGPWAARHTTPEDVLVLEASANSFAVAERLTALGRQVIILESHRAGQIGKSYLANDKVDAAKIARIYLSGLAIKVWQPDAETRQRRELLSTYQRCVKESTRAQQHLRSFLNEHTLRLPKGFRLCRPEAGARLLALKDWTPRQKLLLTEMHGSLLAARERRTRLRRMMALEIEETPDFLRLYKLAGLNLVTTYALVAIIGDITRFATSRKLVSYLGLNPSVVESGNSEATEPFAVTDAAPSAPCSSKPANGCSPPSILCKSGASVSPCAVAKTKPPWRSPANSPSRSGTSCRATGTKPSKKPPPS